jgi:catechol 2,3-dioxygenase-like lactoylglutathione lyase family enzyme
MKIDRIHHTAYRCKDAKTTVEWYVKNLNMDFVLAIAEDLVPSTKAPDPYMHVFLDAGGGNVLAFFELPNSPEMGRDTMAPEYLVDQTLIPIVEDDAPEQIAAKDPEYATLYGF